MRSVPYVGCDDRVKTLIASCSFATPGSTIHTPGSALRGSPVRRKLPVSYRREGTLGIVKTERRAGPRLRLAFPVLVEGPFGLRRCLGRDLSPGGLFIETPDPYERGTLVRVTFSVPDGSWEMTTRCEVRHVARVRGPDGMIDGVGLAFLGVEVEADDLVTVARREHA